MISSRQQTQERSALHGDGHLPMHGHQCAQRDDNSRYRHPLHRPRLERIESGLRVKQRAGIFLAVERTGLEAAQPVDHDGEQHFLCHAVDTVLGYGAVLKVNVEAVLRTVYIDGVVMVRAASAGLIHHADVDPVIDGVRNVVGNLAHSLFHAYPVDTQRG